MESNPINQSPNHISAAIPPDTTMAVLGLERRWAAGSGGHGKQGGWSRGDGGQLALRQPRDGRQGGLRGPWTQAHVCYRGRRRRDMLG